MSSPSPSRTYTELGDAGKPAALHVHTHVREDALQLFGFHHLTEKRLFEKLLTISGIGPRLAITVLSGITADRLVTAIPLRRSRYPHQDPGHRERKPRNVSSWN